MGLEQQEGEDAGVEAVGDQNLASGQHGNAASEHGIVVELSLMFYLGTI